MGANSANNTYPVGSWDVSDNVNGGNGQTGNAKEMCIRDSHILVFFLSHIFYKVNSF